MAGIPKVSLQCLCFPIDVLRIPDYMTKIVVSNVIRYITHFR